MDEKLTQKIRNLNALANQPGTQAEAEQAASALVRLMVRHGLTDADVQEALKTNGGIVTTTFDFAQKDPRPEFRQIILQSLCRSMTSEVIFSYDLSTCAIVGPEYESAVILSLFDYLVQAVRRMTQDEWYKQRAIIQKFGFPLTVKVRDEWIFSHRVGMASTISERLREEAKKEREEVVHSSDMALVPIDPRTKTVEVLHKQFPGMTKSDMLDVSLVGAAFDKGRKRGEDVSLNPQLGNT